MKSLFVYDFILLLVLVCLRSSTANDLYSVLGVNKFASHKEIKLAYKQLAREWHPDKNKSPDAESTFTKINEAYETLGDEERRAKYDRYGETSASESSRSHQPNFNEFFQSSFGDGFTFTFGGGSDSVFDDYIVTLRSYENKIKAETFSRPFIFYVFSDFCIACMQIDHMVEHYFKDLEAVGIGVGAINSRFSAGLMHHLYTHHYPAIVGVVRGRAIHYSGTFQMNSLRQFARDLFPSNSFTQLTDQNFHSFVTGWKEDNKVHIVFFNNRNVSPTRFLVLAFMYGQTAAFGIVDVRSSSCTEVVAKYGINTGYETMLVFKEDIAPVVTMTMQQIPRSTMGDTVRDNLYLNLPRLSSPHFFDNLCPESTNSNLKKLCVVLVTTKSILQSKHVDTFRKFSHENTQERVKFLYVYADVQKQLLRALTNVDNDTAVESHLSQVVIIWRMERHRIGYEWLDAGWTVDNDEQSEDHLAGRVDSLLKSKGHMMNKIILPDLYNEHALHIVVRMYGRFSDWMIRLYDYVLGHDAKTVSLGVLCICVVSVVVMFMRKFADLEQQSVNSAQISSQNHPRRQMYNTRPLNRSEDDSILLYELKLSTYDNLVRRADTGLTVTLLMDSLSRDRLIRNYVSIVYPHSRYSGLTFSMLNLDEHLNWYRRLLEMSLQNQQSIPQINIRNCVGTVLALNGFRRYYYLYHPKEKTKFLKSAVGVEREKESGMFGSDNESDNETETPLFEENLLNGLATWMERIFDGSIHKIRIDEWPDSM